MMPRRWIKSQRAGNEVDDLIGLAPSNYGTELQQVSTSDATAEDFGLPAQRLYGGESESNLRSGHPALDALGEAPDAARAHRRGLVDGGEKVTDSTFIVVVLPREY
jgi:hypothetical protein